MACESNGLSDERIGEALITEVFQEELKQIPSEDVPSLTLPAVEVKNEQEDKFVEQLATLYRKIGEKLNDDTEIQDAIDGLAQEFNRDIFRKMANTVFQDGITWENILSFIYVAGKLAVRMVETHVPQSVLEILKWTVEFFKQSLLSWIQQQGGWICGLSVLAVASAQTAASMSSYKGVLFITFVAGIALGSFITRRMAS